MKLFRDDKKLNELIAYKYEVEFKLLKTGVNHTYFFLKKY